MAGARWRDWNGKEQPFLSDNEVYNLSIRKGTLNNEERKIISDHVVVTIEMLEQLPFPRNLRRVPEYAGGHHERMDGCGYPYGLSGNDIPLMARIILIADTYDAMTTTRPYRKGMGQEFAYKELKKFAGGFNVGSAKGIV